MVYKGRRFEILSNWKKQQEKVESIYGYDQKAMI